MVSNDQNTAIWLTEPQTHKLWRINNNNLFQFGGNGTCGFSGDGGPVVFSAWCRPFGIAFDPRDGSLIITDFGNSRVRRVQGGTGIVTTIAGDGRAAYAGDDGSALTASISGPRDVGVSDTGDVYIVDSGAGRLRVVSAATGIIRTLARAAQAGSMIAMAVLQVPGRVPVILLACDVFGGINAVNASSGVVTRVAGGGYIDPEPGTIRPTGKATDYQLRTPGGVAAASGNFYISIAERNRIYMVSPGGQLSIVAGDGFKDAEGQGRLVDGPGATASFDTPGALFASLSGTRLYVSDWGNNKIRVVTLPFTELPAAEQNSPTPSAVPARVSASRSRLPSRSAMRSRSRNRRRVSRSRTKTRKPKAKRVLRAQ